jgi:hypothetical protein
MIQPKSVSSAVGADRFCNWRHPPAIVAAGRVVDRVGKLGLAGAVICERQQADPYAAGLLLALLGQQHFECAGIPRRFTSMISATTVLMSTVWRGRSLATGSERRMVKIKVHLKAHRHWKVRLATEYHATIFFSP